MARAPQSVARQNDMIPKTVRIVSMKLSPHDIEVTKGAAGEARAFAMHMLLDFGRLYGATKFLDVSWAHVASAYDNTPANHDFAAFLSARGAKVAVPTTLTSCSLDLRTDHQNGASARALIELYRGMGCEATMTCAPYYSHRAPTFGEHLAWCESSAVIYANSVIGARTNRYVEFLDACAAIAGRVPDHGLHRDENRRPEIVIDLGALPPSWLQADWLFEVLGLVAGRLAGPRIPLFEGIPSGTSNARLRSLSASLGVTGAMNMFHADGVTPEARAEGLLQDRSLPRQRVSPQQIREQADALSDADAGAPGAICLGAPHASEAQVCKVLQHLDGRTVNPHIDFSIATSPATAASLDHSGDSERLANQGVRLVTGRCTYYPPDATGSSGTILTDSAKWSSYARNSLARPIVFTTLEDCVETACNGRTPATQPWHTT